MRLVTWLFASAEALYYLIGFFIGVGGLLMFIGSTIHYFVTRERTVRPTYVDNRQVNVHVENLNVTLQLTQSEALELLEKRRRELPPGA